jgi:hypothetical protein
MSGSDAGVMRVPGSGARIVGSHERGLASPVRTLALALFASVVLVLLMGVAPAFGAGPWWHLSAESIPANIPAGGEGQVIIVASNLGDEPAQASSEEPIKFAIGLPEGLTVTQLTGSGCVQETLQCSASTGLLNPYEDTIVSLRVKASAAGVWPVGVNVEGGGAGKTSRTLTVRSGEPAGFGVEEYALEPFNENGTPATLAGAHPFQLTTTLVMNQTITASAGRQPVALPRDFTFNLPPGLVGNPNAAAQCAMVDFFALVFETNLCGPGSVVGVATVTADEPKTLKTFTRSVPVFNLVPSNGEPARFGFEVAGKIPIVIDTSVRSGQDYGVNVSVQNATQTAGLLSSEVTFWGVPADPRHDNARGWECVMGGFFHKQAGKECPETSGLREEPFLSLPTSCASVPQSEPVIFPMGMVSWAEPGSVLGAEYAWMNNEAQLLGFQDCGGLEFEPSILITPQESVASTPTGLDVSVRVPQAGTLAPAGRAQADVRDTTVTLPQGVALSPAAANGLEACSETQVGYTGINPVTRSEEFNSGEAACPKGSKVGTVKVKTPLLSHELEGGVYLASPAPNGEPGRNPFDSLIALYIVAEDPVSGVLVKLAGEGHVDEGSLQITTSFKNTPQVPFEELYMHLFGGQRASVTTPETCGSYATSALFVPWSAPEMSVPAPPTQFAITAGVGGSGCPAGGLGFGPGFTAYSQNTLAGAFTGFELQLSRPDGDQALSSVAMHLPPGVAALLSSVQLCSDAQAAVSACPAGSLVGEAVAVAGLGSEPYVQRGGRVYITGPYGDAPFGLEIVTPAQAGPFDLGYVTVRSGLYIDPNNASVTIVSDPLPTQIKGIPLQLKRVLVTVNRPGFEFNPTTCDPMSIDGTISGAQGATAAVSSRFQASNCEALPFDPQLTASAVGHGSKTEGTTFAVTVTSGGVNSGGVAQAGIAKVQLQLPGQLSSRLSTLQKACIDTVFNINPASCGEESVIGHATIHTPVLDNPLTGPAYLVSHGGAAFPDVEFVLQGEGITLVLDGQTDIKEGITYSRFETTPDAPFTIFETVLPAGPHGVLTPNVPEAKRFSLCGETLKMPTTIIAQNGKRIDKETNVAITGCETQQQEGEVKGTQTKLTLKGKLKHALHACKHKYKRSKKRRVTCEHQAHAHYTRQALSSCRHKYKHTPKKRKACERTARKHYTAKNARHTAKSSNARHTGKARRAQHAPKSIRTRS